MISAIIITLFSMINPQALQTDGATIQFIHPTQQVDQFEIGATLFSNRGYVLAELPPQLEGLSFLRDSIDLVEIEVVEPGILLVLTPYKTEIRDSQINLLKGLGFESLGIDDFQLFGNQDINRVTVMGKRVDAGESFRFPKWTVVLGFAEAKEIPRQDWTTNTGELLYNGIRLPEIWPPRTVDITDRSPMRIPYLEHPPEVIVIDVGRQLFIDDFLIEETNLRRRFHSPEKYEGNPVLKAETPLELGQIQPKGYTKMYGENNAGAVPKSGGCWWDPDEQVFKMWYEASWFGPIAMVTSKDGIHWERPDLDVWPGTNVVSPPDIQPDSWTVVPDWNTTNPDRRWTLFVQPPGPAQHGTSLVSPDGIHWNERTVSGYAGDRSTHHYNPFRQKWVYSLRTSFQDRGRARSYFETHDFFEGAHWGRNERIPWMMTDERDPVDFMIRETPSLYNFDAVAYESIMLGWFQIHHGPSNQECRRAGLPKITELMYAFSRDGFHYDRPDRRAHIEASRGNFWDRGYIQSLGNILVIMGDYIYFYYIGYAGNPAQGPHGRGHYDNGATGLAILRRDGFASMDAVNRTGELTTRPLTFSGSRLFFNLDAPEGSLRVEIRDENNQPIEPFTLENSNALSTDSTLTAFSWKGGADLSALAGQTIRFHFELTNGSLYSFWVSKDETGRSDGYIAGGGPGYFGPTDTVGLGAFEVD